MGVDICGVYAILSPLLGGFMEYEIVCDRDKDGMDVWI